MNKLKLILFILGWYFVCSKIAEFSLEYPVEPINVSDYSCIVQFDCKTQTLKDLEKIIEKTMLQKTNYKIKKGHLLTIVIKSMNKL